MTEYSRLDGVRIVLVHTSHPGNIGAAARAMKTMGLSQLALVRPKYFPHPDAEALAAGGIDVLQRATVFDSLDEALKGTTLVVGSTARSRDLPHETVDCREACRRLMSQAQTGAVVALVFGAERTGLTIEEVTRCQLMATIGAAPEYPSLNLAQAVQLFAYELRLHAGQALAPSAAGDAATYEQLESFYAHLEEVLRELRFLDDKHPGRMMRRLRRLFARARLEQEEVNILRGVLRAIRSKVE